MAPSVLRSEERGLFVKLSEIIGMIDLPVKKTEKQFDESALPIVSTHQN